MQALVDSTQLEFDQAVMQGRGMGAAQLAAVRHGGVLTAADGIHAGLVDSIGTLESVIDSLSQPMVKGKKPIQVQGSLPMLADCWVPASSESAGKVLRGLPMLSGR